ncbi:hypothetical protein QL093DRAFT_1130311 [Fusarium oxysporum]|nr:hypothetical protein QL093DRAFT_1130311 [Fusarium oxysporum]
MTKEDGFRTHSRSLLLILLAPHKIASCPMIATYMTFDKHVSDRPLPPGFDKSLPSTAFPPTAMLFSSPCLSRHHHLDRRLVSRSPAPIW